MPPKKAEKVPRRARAHSRAPSHGAGLKVVGASMVILAVGVGWLSNLGDEGSDSTTAPYRQSGVTTIAGGEYRHLLPSSRAAVPVPFGGANTLVTVDDGLVTTTTTTTEPPVGVSAEERPGRSWIVWWPVRPPKGRGSIGGSSSSSTTRPTTTTTTRPTTTTSSTTTSTSTTSTSTTSTTSTSTTSTSTTSTTEPTTTTTGGSTTTDPPDGRP